MNKLLSGKSEGNLRQNVEMVLRDKDGKIKLLWSNNKFGSFLLRMIRRFFSNKQIALNGIQIPFLTGSWGESLRFHNLITNTGFAAGASRLNGAGSEAAFTFIAVGTGAVAAAATDTALGAETTTSGLARAAATASRVTTTVTNDTARLNKQFSVTGSVAVTESGPFNASSAGVMLARQVFSAVNVVNGDTLDVTWDVKVS